MTENLIMVGVLCKKSGAEIHNYSLYHVLINMKGMIQ